MICSQDLGRKASCSVNPDLGESTSPETYPLVNTPGWLPVTGLPGYESARDSVEAILAVFASADGDQQKGLHPTPVGWKPTWRPIAPSERR